MKTSELTYRKFEHTKSINELLYNNLLWKAEFEFNEIELAFIKDLIQSGSFDSRAPNLYERLQLFTQEIELLQKSNKSILKKLLEQNNNLNGKLYYETFELNAYEKLAEKIFNFLKTYKNFKMRIFEYVDGIINNK
jgi:hypothetical protein